MKRSCVNRESKKRASQHDARNHCRNIVLTRDRICRACGTAAAAEVHEMARGQWRRFAFLEPDACLGLCPPCHMWVTLNPEQAIGQGLAWDAGTAERWLRDRGLIKPKPGGTP